MVAAGSRGSGRPGGPRPGLPARGHREGHTVGRARSPGARPDPDVHCTPGPHFATFAVFNHTRPHAPRRDRDRGVCVWKNSGMGVRVGFDSACVVQAQSHTPPALRLALHWVPGTNLSRTSWAHGEGCHVQGLGRSLLLFSRSVVSSSLPPHGLQHARLPCPSLSTGVQPSLCPLNR